MKTIYKYDATITYEFTIAMPVGAEVLCVQMQNDKPQIWALVDPKALINLRTFHWRGTGQPADELGRYIGTVQEMGGKLVFHLFEAVCTS